MAEVIEAHRRLLEIAESGPEYRRDQVFKIGSDACNGADILGRGRDFEKPVQVVDRDGVPSIAGRAALRLLGMRKPDGSSSLFIRTRLDWETETGNHSSLASYNIGAAEAASLDAAAQNPVHQPTKAEASASVARKDTEELLGIVSDCFTEASRYQAEWVQTFPGSDTMFDDIENVDWGAIQVEDNYHQAAVLAAQKSEPQLLAMLSDIEFGTVMPEELPNVLAWTEENMDLAIN